MPAFSLSHDAEHRAWKRDRTVFLSHTRPLTSTGERTIQDEGEYGAYEMSECRECTGCLTWTLREPERKDAA